MSNLGYALFKQGRVREAEPLLLRALAGVEQRLGAQHPAATPNLDTLARLNLRAGRPAQAVEFARRALRAHRTTGVEAGGESPEQARFSAGRKGLTGILFARSAWSAAKLDPRSAPALRAEAFEALQNVSSSGAGAALAANASRIAASEAGLGPIVTAWRAAQERLVAIDQGIMEAARGGAASDLRRQALQADRVRTQADRDAHERELRRKFPRFFDLVAGAALSLREAQSLLREEEVAVVFAAGDETLPEGHRRGLVFAFSATDAAWAEIALEPAALQEEIAALHANVQDRTRPFDRVRAFTLYRSIFGDADVSRLVTAKSHMILVPQGVFLSLPFAALVTAPAEASPALILDDADLRATPWLGIRQALSVNPWLPALRTQRASTAAATPISTFFGVGDPIFSGDAGLARGRTVDARSFFRDGMGDVQAIRTLAPLPATRPEIERLARTINPRAREGVDYVLGANATETEVRRRSLDGRLARAQVVAFATHGLVAGDFDGLNEPALVFTPPARASLSDDGLITASEAAQLRLNARWVLLSACNTAAGGRPGAEGLAGLARAFFYAGAQAMLVSQWPVDDEGAQRLTTRAFEIQRSGAPAAAAMRQSMTELMQDANGSRSFAHPALWAPYILVGGG